MDYKKKVREQEVEELTEHKNLLEHDLHDISKCMDEIQKEKEQVEKERDAVIKKTEVLEKRFSALNSKAGLVDSHAREYGYYPEEWMVARSRNFRVGKILSEENISFGEKSCEHDTGII